MTGQLFQEQAKLAKLIERYTAGEGIHPTAMPALFFNRATLVTGPSYSILKPALCIVVQGEKDIWLAKERFRYTPADYLVASLEVPVSGQVVAASPEIPYLSLKLEFTPNQVLEVLNDFKMPTRPKEQNGRAIFVSRLDLPLLDAVSRLAHLLDHPADIPMLAPLFTKEILYRVLQGQHGVVLEQIALASSNVYRIKDVIERLVKNYNQPFRIEDLADIANMSVSSLHRHFREVISMSPIQFQKQLRLQEARKLLLAKSTDAADVAFQVGYESPSQFSREYARLFGYPPREDVKRLRSGV